MTYKEELQSAEWKFKRVEILERDDYRCTNCNVERTKFLGLDKNFGIKKIEELKEDGYSIMEEMEGVVILEKSFLTKTKFIGPDESKLNLKNLKFAKQWKEPKNPLEFKSFDIICFYDDISEDDKFPDLNIHHKYYIKDNKAWEYKNEVLVTLCQKCHKIEHEENEILVYSEAGEILHKADLCVRCGGSGYLPEFSFYQNGICFGCQGHGVTL